MPDVSITVVVCTYNRCESLKDTLEALGRQELPGGVTCEILVVDNNSADNTKAVVESFIGRGRWPVRYVFEGQQGQSAARNRGIREARAGLIAFTDDDVIPEPTWLAALWDVFQRHDVACVGGRILPLWAHEPPAWLTHPALRNMLWGVLALLDRGDELLIDEGFPKDTEPLYGASMAFRKSLFDEIGGFRTDIGCLGAVRVGGEDVELFTRLFNAGHRIAYTPEAVVQHKVQADRMRLAYFRGMEFRIGRAAVIVQGDGGRRLEGWVARECLQHVLRAAGGLLTGHQARRIRHELLAWFFLGRLSESLRKPARQAPAPTREHPRTRVLIIEHGLGRGGSTRSLLGLLAYIDQSRCEPVVLLDSYHASAELFEEAGVPYIRQVQPWDRFIRYWKILPPLSYLAYIFELGCAVLPHAYRLTRLIRRERFDVVHLNNHLDGQFAGIMAAHWAGVPVICHLRNQRKLRWSEVWMSQYVDEFIALSASIRRTYVAQGLPEDRITVLYDPIQITASGDGRERIREEFNIPRDAQAVGIMSRLVEGKGHDDFLRAAAGVVRECPNTCFLIVGKEDRDNGPVTRTLHQLTEELGLAGRVIFTGWRADVSNIIRALDVVVDASRIREGTRLTILESMALGKPVIATNVGGEAEFFEEDRGVLIEPGQPGALAEAMMEVLRNPSRAQRMGHVARRFVALVCDPMRSAKLLGELYDTVGRRDGQEARVEAVSERVA